jgi:hypothetical protein
VEFRVATDDQLDHLVAAIREHAEGAHDHEVTREHVLAELGDSFLAAVRDIGLPVTGLDVTEAPQGLSTEDLGRAFAAHGITNVGPPVEQAEAERLIGQLALHAQACGARTDR